MQRGSAVVGGRRPATAAAQWLLFLLLLVSTPGPIVERLPLCMLGVCVGGSAYFRFLILLSWWSGLRTGPQGGRDSLHSSPFLILSLILDRVCMFNWRDVCVFVCLSALDLSGLLSVSARLHSFWFACLFAAVLGVSRGASRLVAFTRRCLLTLMVPACSGARGWVAWMVLGCARLVGSVMCASAELRAPQHSGTHEVEGTIMHSSKSYARVRGFHVFWRCGARSLCLSCGG